MFPHLCDLCSDNCTRLMAYADSYSVLYSVQSFYSGTLDHPVSHSVVYSVPWGLSCLTLSTHSFLWTARTRIQSSRPSVSYSAFQIIQSLKLAHFRRSHVYLLISAPSRPRTAYVASHLSKMRAATPPDVPWPTCAYRQESMHRSTTSRSQNSSRMETIDFHGRPR